MLRILKCNLRRNYIFMNKIWFLIEFFYYYTKFFNFNVAYRLWKNYRNPISSSEDYKPGFVGFSIGKMTNI